MGQGEGHGEGKGHGGAGLLRAIMWFFILILLAWPIAFFVSWLYVLLLPFGACIKICHEACDSLLKIVRLPFTCAENMINMNPVC